MPPRARLAIVGIGNTLAGDDGAGVRAVEMLRERLGGSGPDGVLLTTLEGDLLAVSDMIGSAGRFIFVDAVAGEPPGMVTRGRSAPRAFAPSFHQTDIGSVMHALERLRATSSFPDWEILGVTVRPPRMLEEKLSPEVEEALPVIVDLLLEEMGEERSGRTCEACRGGGSKA